MKQKEIIKMLTIITEALKDIKTETLEDATYLTDDVLRSKAKYILLRIFLEDEDE